MYMIDATLKGLAPVMFNRFFNLKDLDDKGSKKKAKLTWKEELPLMMWQDKLGVYVPADNIRMMLIGNKLRPGAAKILGSFIETKKGTEYTQFCKSCVWVIGKGKDPLKVHFSPKRETYDDYDERSFINAQGSRSLIRRPILTMPWSVSFDIQVTDDQMHESKIRQLFEVAGLRCGLGAYGPTFGRCEVTKWSVK